MLVKFTEICTNGAVTTQQDFMLREIFVNPEHVIMIREERRLQELNERGMLAAGLDPNHRFSKLTINRGQAGTDIVVVGAPDTIKAELNLRPVSKKKQILRG
tara:strand:- start:209 stop:514 length:306 start_codon:yes stop_codon:yes gene_type:complete